MDSDNDSNSSDAPPPANPDFVIREEKILSQDIGGYFNNELYSDLTLIVGEKRIHAHKFILCVRSEYFRTLLTNGMSESNKKEISIEEPKVVVFEKLLRFLYSGEMKLVGTNEKVEMLVMANKYLFTKLEKSIEDHLDAHLTMGSFCSIYSAAFACSASKLLEKCFKMADSKPSEILRLDGISKLDDLALNEILRRESFTPTLAELFEAISKWIGANKDKDADVLLSNIRLEEIPESFLQETVRPSKLFSETRILDAMFNRPPPAPIKVMVVISDWSHKKEYEMGLLLYPFETIARVKDRIRMQRNKAFRSMSYNTIQLFVKDPMRYLAEDDQTIESYSIRTGARLQAVCR